jgi:hypothetical protein
LIDLATCLHRLGRGRIRLCSLRVAIRSCCEIRLVLGIVRSDQRYCLAVQTCESRRRFVLSLPYGLQEWRFSLRLLHSALATEQRALLLLSLRVLDVCLLHPLLRLLLGDVRLLHHRAGDVRS